MVKLRESWRDVKVGAKFDKLTVLGQLFTVPRNPKGHAWFCVCECDCGVITAVNTSVLHYRRSKSCGCHRSAVSKKLGKVRETHGQSRSALYSVWGNIKDRCLNPCSKDYDRYGARGVAFHKEWADNYETFRDYALANGYRKGLQFDRFPDVDGNYEPGNVRLVTSKENNRNRRNTPFVTAWGETKSISEWSDDARCNVSRYTLKERLTGRRCGKKWIPEHAISLPPTKGGLKSSDAYLGPDGSIKTIYEARGLTPRDKNSNGQRGNVIDS